ncbi:CARDB domain-containing protein [Massilia sp. W12]|uniref:CARDB domain-containing protein n=1 Tax=Massilia sp. W12 TaxID=3126507 RepID=UPI0030CF0F50
MNAKSIAIACTLLCASWQALAAGADLQAITGIKIGGGVGTGGKQAAWGGALSLSEADAFMQSNGKCAFNLSYIVKNAGDMATEAKFRNQIFANSTVVSIQSNLSAGAGESRVIHTQAYLPQGDYQLSLKLDTDGQVLESNEANNQASIKLSFKGACQGKPVENKTGESKTGDNKNQDKTGDNKSGEGKPADNKTGDNNNQGKTGDKKTDAKTDKPVETPRAELHAVGGVKIGSKTGPWGGSVELGASDIVLAANGKCAVNLSYQIENSGRAAANGFANRFTLSNGVGAENMNLKLAAGAKMEVKTQLYLNPMQNTLTLLVDNGNRVSELDENNNRGQMRIYVGNACKGKPTEQKKTEEPKKPAEPSKPDGQKKTEEPNKPAETSGGKSNTTSKASDSGRK